jgi:hypothetical protein
MVLVKGSRGVGLELIAARLAAAGEPATDEGRAAGARTPAAPTPTPAPRSARDEQRGTR